MKFYLSKIHKIINKNIEFFLLFFLIIFAIFSTQIYNLNKERTIRNLISLTDNIYFQKNLEHIIGNLKPKFKNVTHIVKSGESFNSILKKYNISDQDIKKLNIDLLKIQKSYKLKINQTVKFTFDQSDNNKITYLLFPVSKTKKIELKKSLDENKFIKKEIVTNLNKR